ncbi:MAG: 30S ribosomal protein S17 [Patescibacteria group bacterium]
MLQETVKKNKAKTLKGVVVSNKMQKTLVVLTQRFVKHPKYEKYRTVSKKYKAHYDEGSYEVGDKVEIMECNPISKEKRFRIVK